jgi:hypothetical protein
MTFDEMYPDAPDFFEPYHPQGSEVIKCLAEQPCWMCQRQTHWVEVNFECHLCSPECVDQAWGEFFEACEATKGQIRAIFGEAGEIANPSATAESQTP